MIQKRPIEKKSQTKEIDAKEGNYTKNGSEDQLKKKHDIRRRKLTKKKDTI
jgi:hypothetical protein